MEKKMSRREFIKASAAAGAILSTSPSITLAEEPKTIQLLKPQPGSDSPLIQLLWKRKSSREFSSKPLPVEVLSDLLWAGFGINRPDGKRTAPYARASMKNLDEQDMDIYVILPDGLYLYDPKANQLKLIAAEDLRGLAGTQPFVKEAPVNLIYVSDHAKMGDKTTNEQKMAFSFAHAAFISQNVYLYCASEGLATVVRAWIDRPALSKAMKLQPDQKIILAQS
ncbi:MAG TPA: nitroreductase family protein, partial [Syntrophales bacterium]|nr:nitroreductase family protein [Syntrophales bacterium]